MDVTGETFKFKITNKNENRRPTKARRVYCRLGWHLGSLLWNMQMNTQEHVYSRIILGWFNCETQKKNKR